MFLKKNFAHENMRKLASKVVPLHLIEDSGGLVGSLLQSCIAVLQSGEIQPENAPRVRLIALIEV